MRCRALVPARTSGRPGDRAVDSIQPGSSRQVKVGARLPRAVDFWFNHFNVFAGKGEVRWYVTSYERDVIRPLALATFPDLVRATARHPAMLFYLDNWLST